MNQIPYQRVNKKNTNLRKYSDFLWRELRRLRFKPANPNCYSNELAAEEARLSFDGDTSFDHDVKQFISLMLSPREGDIFHFYVYGGKISQMEIAKAVGVSQGTVATDLARILGLFKEFYYGKG